MTNERIHVPFRVRRRTLMYRAVFCRREVIVMAGPISREVDRKAACHNESHSSTLLLLDVSACVHILLVGVRLSLEHFQLSELQAFLH